MSESVRHRDQRRHQKANVFITVPADQKSLVSFIFEHCPPAVIDGRFGFSCGRTVFLTHVKTNVKTKTTNNKFVAVKVNLKRQLDPERSYKMPLVTFLLMAPCTRGLSSLSRVKAPVLDLAKREAKLCKGCEGKSVIRFRRHVRKISTHYLSQ